MRVGIRDAERLKVSRLPPHPSGLRPCPPTPSGLQPSPPDRGSRPSPLWGEGFGAAQIRRNLALCGTFGYIYWELGRSAPTEQFCGWQPRSKRPKRKNRPRLCRGRFRMCSVLSTCRPPFPGILRLPTQVCTSLRIPSAAGILRDFWVCVRSSDLP